MRSQEPPLITFDISSIRPPLQLQLPTMLVADVPTNGSPTPCRSKNPPKSTSSSDSRTSGYKPQNTSNIQPILDETVDQILVRVGSPLGEGEVREAVETLEKVSKGPRLPGIGASNQRTTGIAITAPNRSAYEGGMFPGTREDLPGIRYPPRLIYHPWVQGPEGRLYPHLIGLVRSLGGCV